MKMKDYYLRANNNEMKERKWWNESESAEKRMILKKTTKIEIYISKPDNKYERIIFKRIRL